MGYDSLFLTQVAQKIQSQMKVKVTFRQLLGDFSTIPSLAKFLAEKMPAPAVAAPAVQAAALQAAAPVAPAAASWGTAAPGARPAAPTFATVAPVPGGGAGIEGLFRDQLQAMSQLMNRQFEMLQGLGGALPMMAAPSPAGATPVASPAAAPLTAPAGPAAAPAPTHIPTAAEAASAAAVAAEAPAESSRFAVFMQGKGKNADHAMTPEQRRHIDALTERYTRKTAGSKAFTQAHRAVLADPRAAAGFRAEWKEMVYPIVCERSHGSKIWDVDGNEYIDLVNGYGQTAFGHAPEFVTQAVALQMQRGFAIGPQAELAGQISELFRDMTGNERMTFCNTGSEAVMAALRIARAVTGRTKVVVFNGAYHGQFDEVLVKGLARSSGNPRSLPVAPGIPDSAVSNLVVLDYATDEALAYIREHADELAAVVAEPVQSRHPALRPVAFLKAMREITEASGTAFIMDEVVTGFRTHPGGMQAVMGIRADMATYGKVVGGGLPIGILAGKAAFMDALDGGAWQYGDDSVPEAAVTFFAGTFVRHPLTLAATWAVLNHLKDAGPALQERLAERAGALVDRLRTLFRIYGIGASIENFSSFFYFNLGSEHPLAALLFQHLRYRGVHIQDGFPCFLTTAHTDADMDAIVRAFDESLAELASVGIFTRQDASAPAAALAQVPLTENQMEIWLAAQLGEDASCAFNESVTLSLDGMLDRDALQTALDQVVARHESLRARFSPTGEGLSIAAAEPVRFAFHDLTGADAGAFEAIVDQDARTPVDLVGGPVFRAHLARLGADRHALILTAHHIVCDGWSINVIVNELAEIYRAAVTGRPVTLPDALRFSQYTLGQASATDERAKTEAYWLGKFERLPMPLDLPTDRPRAAIKSFSGSSRSRRIDRELHQALKAAGAKLECTLFVTLLAAFETLMGRLAGQSEVVIGVPTAGQSLIDDEAPLVGHCVNFLPIRGHWKSHTTVADHMQRVAAQVLEAYEHQNYTFGTLVRKLAMAREINRLPLTEVQFNLERLSERMDLPGLSVEIRPNAKAFVNFDIFLNVIESKQGLRLDCDYNTDLWDAATIDRWLDYYEMLLRSFVGEGARPVAQVDLLPPAERQWLLSDLNATKQAFPADSSVDLLIKDVARQYPDRIAVTAAGHSLSYRDLDAKANAMAHHILEQVDRPGALIGICVERSADMLVALLGVLKAGCAYVPLDPRHPLERRRLILGEAGVAALITSDRDLIPMVGADCAIIDPLLGAAAARSALEPPAVARSANQLAYVIYTSGTTGRPKGVEISHRAVVNLLTSMAREPGFDIDDTLLAVTTIAFDIAALELFLPLTVGGKVVIAGSDEVSDGFKLQAALVDSGATVMQATPATWRLLLEAQFTAPARFKMLCGGEPLPRDLATQLLQTGGRLWNMYGPTETTIWSSCIEITIGAPIANTEFYVLDRYDQLTPIGVPGQLHIGGEGLARGYFKAQELTLDKFIANPFGGPSPRLYRAGDVARRMADGTIRLSGRLDHQVKLRGFRIELGEIEAAIARQPGIAACAVALRSSPSGASQLVGYFVPRDRQAVSPQALRSALSAVLPDYMVPTNWVSLDAMPLSPNGKLDRAALPAPETAPQDTADQAEPASPLEAQILAIWKDVLKLDQIGTNEDLLDLGADSIHFFQITARANRDGLQIAAKQLLRHRTVASLAAFLQTQGNEGAVEDRAKAG
jgi:amino acid adenylation domain-containing protein